jgi:predicted enzyme related to lactoylglutathione lyase
MSMTNPIGSFIWYELMTTDPDGARDFYGKVVGWKITGQPDPQAGGPDYRHIIRDDGGSNGGVLGLSKEMCDGGARPCWMGYLYVADVDVEVKAIVAEGGKSLMPAFDLEVGRIAMVMDPQGIPIYVMKPIPPAHEPDASSDVYERFGVQHVSWNELYTPDIEGSKAFYAKHFHFEYNDKMPMGPMGDYWFIDHGGETIGAMMQKPPHVPMPGWNYYIRVADIDTAVETVKASGGQVLNGPMEVPGGEWIINGMDPQGAPFSLVGTKGQ